MQQYLAEYAYSGGVYTLVVLFGIGAMAYTMPPKGNKRKVVWQGTLVSVLAFVLGVLAQIGITGLDLFVYEMSVDVGSMEMQFLYLGLTLATVLSNTLPAIIVAWLVVNIFKGQRNIKIFISIIFMLVNAAILRFFAKITYIPFTKGDDGYSRYDPEVIWRFIINFGWLLVVFVIYKKILSKRLKDLLAYAEEQMGQMVLVASLSYIAFEFVISTLSTYEITIMAVEPITFSIALIVSVCMLLIYFLMYWAIFKAAIVSAGSAKVKAELDVASKIQLSALPNKFPAFPKRDEIDIYATMHPAKEVGGDFYDFFFIDDDHLAVLIADVSGKGVPAALFMMSGRSIIRNQALLGMEPGEIFNSANKQLVENNKEGMFITAFLGILNVKNGEFKFTNAGHNVPYRCKENGVVEEFAMQPGFVLAGLKRTKYQTEVTTLDKHEKLLLYTDGVTEAINPKMDMYMEERLEEVLKNSDNKTVKEMVGNVVESVQVFAEDAEQADDITMLMVERC